MKHAIEFLEKESEELNKILTEWGFGYQPEAMKLRSDKLKSLEDAIKYLKSAESFNNAAEGKTL